MEFASSLMLESFALDALLVVLISGNEDEVYCSTRSTWII
jgi:hypothetical protein